MEREGYAVTANHEATHWWFRARRDLVLLQVRRAAAEIGHPVRRLRLLDYGCGTGFMLDFLASLGEAVGADACDLALGEFQRASRFPRLDLRHDLSEHHGRYDLVTALDVLEHLEDDVTGLRDMARFLAPDGQLVLTVPAYGWLWSGEDVISRHRRRYTRRTLEGACRAAGLTVAWISYFNLTILPGMTAVVWARRVLGARRNPQSNLTATPGWLDGVLYGVTGREAAWVGEERVRLPAGASLVCRLRTPHAEVV